MTTDEVDNNSRRVEQSAESTECVQRKWKNPKDKLHFIAFYVFSASFSILGCLIFFIFVFFSTFFFL